MARVDVNLTSELEGEGIADKVAVNDIAAYNSSGNNYSVLLNTADNATVSIKVTCGGDDYVYTHTTPLSLAKNHVYTFYVTVKKTGLEVTVGETVEWISTDPQSVGSTSADNTGGDTPSVNGWTNGGNESITSVKYLPLPTAKNGVVTISDGKAYRVDKSSNATQIVVTSGAPTLLLDSWTVSRTTSGDIISITGDAKIVLSGTTTLSTSRGVPIVASDGTLTIEAENGGSLSTTSTQTIGAGIELVDNANLVINSGTITANGGTYGAGIGAGRNNTCGNITINGGTVTASSAGGWGAGIGTGQYGSCGDITICAGTVSATGGSWAAGIGSGSYGSCGNIKIVNCRASGLGGGWGSGYTGGWGAGIGAGQNGSCGNITIADGAVVTAHHGEYGYDIGESSTCTGIGIVWVDTTCLTSDSGKSISNNTAK